MFADQIKDQIKIEALPKTDAIVVLTGGTNRVDMGWALFKAAKADKIFISGVDEKVTPDELIKVSGVSKRLISCCVFLGYEAMNTRGNALEVQKWIEDQHIKSVTIVTGNYHMQRSLLEFQMALPEVTLVPYPVYSPHVETERWWQRVGTRQLIISEYNKFLLTYARYLITCLS